MTTFRFQSTISRRERKTVSGNNRRVRLAALLLLIALCFSTRLFSQLIGWDANNNGGGFGASPWAPATLNTNITMVNTGLTRGASILTSGTPAGSCWGGGGGGWGTTDAGSVFFSFRPDAGYEVSLTSITAAIRRSNSGPATYQVSYSLNGGAYTNVGTWSNSTTSGTTGGANSSTLTGFANLQHIQPGTTVRFRITFPGASGGNWYITGGTNSLRLNGTVVPVTASCNAPANLSAANITDETADLSWNPVTGSNGYEYVIDELSTDPAGGGEAVAGNAVAATGLLPSTNYYLHVRTKCGTSDVSDWVTYPFSTLTPCNAPSNIAMLFLTTTTAELVWDEINGVAGYEYILDEVATDPLVAGTFSVDALHDASGLTYNTTYYLHVRARCAPGHFSDWTTFSFTTPFPPCDAPTSLSSTYTTPTTAGLNWLDVTGIVGYEYVLDQESADPAGAGTATTDAAYAATGLDYNTTYYMHVRIECEAANFSGWTTYSFTTPFPPCDTPVNLSVSNLMANTADLTWDEVTGIEGYEYVLDELAADPAGAGTATTDALYNATALAYNTTYYLHVRNECHPTNFSDWTTYSFTTPFPPCAAPTNLSVSGQTANTADLTWDAVNGIEGYEYVLDQLTTDPAGAGTATADAFYNASGLTYNTTYYLHVRIECQETNFSEWTTYAFTTSFPPCAAPTNLSVSNLTATTADLSWNAVPGIYGYEYVLDNSSANPSITGTTTADALLHAVSLLPNTTYYLHVRIECEATNFSGWVTYAFTTLSNSCPAPTGLNAANVGSSSALLSWNAVSGISYQYVVNQVPADPAGSGIAAAQTSFTISGLTGSATYYLHVRAHCGGTDFSVWKTIPFTTLAALGLSSAEEKQNFRIYPNPAESLINIQVTGEPGIVQLMSIDGKVLENILFAHEQTIQLDLTPYLAGSYFLRYTAGGSSKMLKFIRK